MTDDKLKPCPFCGGKAMINGITLVYIKCTKCGVETVGYREEDEAITAWNRRAKDDND